MNRHPFRWEGLAFGVFFLAMIGQWAVWERDLLEPPELAYVNATALIVLGAIGILVTVVRSRADHRVAPFTPTPERDRPDETLTDTTEDPTDSTDEGTHP